MEDKEEIFNHASTIRKAILLYLKGQEDSKEEAYLRMIEFPTGACTEASTILGIYLREKGISDIAEYYSTDLEGMHVWLKSGDLDIDITPDQFDNIEQEVTVSADSVFHKNLSNANLYSTDLVIGHKPDWLINAYREIVKIASEIE